ncbi:hypothetical protein LCGC14_1502890 [marine sediment metagenome]
MASEFDGIAYFKSGSCSFLLQDFYEPAHSKNFMMHLLVEDAHGWYAHVLKLKLDIEFGVKVTELIEQPWGMIEFCFTDPSGVLWRIAENQCLTKRSRGIWLACHFWFALGFVFKVQCGSFCIACQHPLERRYM